MDNIVVKKVGVVYKPPALVILYKEKVQYKKRTMPIRDLTVHTDCYTTAQRIKARHKRFLAGVNPVRLEKLIRLAQEVSLKGSDPTSALKVVRSEFEVDPSENLNKLSDKELKRRKDIMDLTFAKNSIGAEHPDFVYDKEVEFEGDKVANEWDSDGSSSTTPINSPKKVAGKKNPKATNEWGSDDGSTPIHSPNASKTKKTTTLFGLESPEPELAEPPSNKEEPDVPEEKPLGGLSAGEDQDEEDDFW